MPTRIIAIDPDRYTHWEYAKKNGFWDLLTRSNLLHAGDDVLFWVTGSPGRVVGRAVLGSDPSPIPDAPHAWSDDDPRRGMYNHRVKLEELTDLDPVEIRYSEARMGAGLGGRLNPVTPVPDSGVSWLEQRLGIALDPFDRASHSLAADFSYSRAADIDVTVFDRDTRRPVPVSVILRRGQRRFRADLMAAYSGRCAITGTALPDVLEAAHISPYRGDHTNASANGILLRADIHTLFDLYLLTVTYDGDDAYVVRVAPDAVVEPYSYLDGRPLRQLPSSPWSPPQPELLNRHHGACPWLMNAGGSGDSPR